MTGGDDLLVRDMGCSEAEFARWLPGATGGAPIESSVGNGQTRHLVATGDGKVEIFVQTQPPRRIAGIVLPVLRVTFRFIDLAPAQRRAFLTRFDRYTQRGGG